MDTLEDINLKHRTLRAGPNPESDTTGSLDFVCGAVEYLTVKLSFQTSRWQ